MLMVPMVKQIDSYAVQLFMAGDPAHAKQLLRQMLYPPNQGLCVTVTPTEFIYTGGQEFGFVVGFVNYPRFPALPESILERVRAIAQRLIPELGQWSALIVAPDVTEWISFRPADKPPSPAPPL